MVRGQIAASEPSLAQEWRWRGLSAMQSAGLLILLGTLLRIALTPFGRYDTDNAVLAFRASRIAALPLRSLYATNQGVIDHLPGDLWFMWYVTNAYSALVVHPDFRSHSFLIVTKLVPILTDAAAAFALFLLARDLAGPKAGVLAAALYAFNPGPIFIASTWDQWDSISTCALLFAIWFFLRRRYVFAAAALTYASLIKPQYSALGLLFALAFLRWNVLPAAHAAWSKRGSWRALIRPVAAAIGAVAAAIVTAAALLVPFGVGFWPLKTQFTIFERIHYVYLIHDETSLNAFTLWATPLVGNGVNDWQFHFLGLETGVWGRIFLGLGLFAVLALWWGRGTERAFAWACLAMTFCLFMLPTRIHERYLFPTVALAALVAAIQPRRLWFCFAISAMFAINVIAVFWFAHAKQGAPFFDRHNPWVMLGALINTGLFVWVMARGLPGADEMERAGWRVPRLGGLFKPSAGTPTQAR
jgi:Gpi18-like mannosyltransferase